MTTISQFQDLTRAMSGPPDAALKPVLVQLYEMLQLYVRRGIGPRYYLTAGLNERGVGLSEVLGHINEAEYIQFVQRANPPERRKALNNKIEQKRLLVAAGVPTPRPVYGAAAGKADPAALEEALRPLAGSVVAVKLAASFAGRGFRAFRVVGDGSRIRLADLDGGEMLSADELVATIRGDFIVEPYVRQHPWYAALNASSVNTWRIWVLKRPDGTSETILAYLRMGRAGSRVDNMGGGGIFAPLLSNGTLGSAQDGTIFRRSYPAHPDSGCLIEGVRPPLAIEAKQLAEQALTAITDLKFGGIDVAVTENGPVVIEVNGEPDRLGAARVRLPFKSWLASRGLNI